MLLANDIRFDVVGGRRLTLCSIESLHTAEIVASPIKPWPPLGFAGLDHEASILSQERLLAQVNLPTTPDIIEFRIVI